MSQDENDVAHRSINCIKSSRFPDDSFRTVTPGKDAAKKVANLISLLLGCSGGGTHDWDLVHKERRLYSSTSGRGRPDINLRLPQAPLPCARYDVVTRSSYRMLEIIDQVFQSSIAHAEPDQESLNRSCPLFPGNGGMRHRGGMIDQRLHNPTRLFRQGENYLV